MAVLTTVLCLSGLVLALFVPGVQASRPIGATPEHAQPMRTFVPQWMGKGKFSSGMLFWEADSPRPHSYSQSEEDTVAEARYFHNLHNGTFLELGALDGTTFSNTRFFEEQRGWRGVLIEANREEFEKIPETRTEAIAVHAAICAQSQDVHFISRRSYHQEPGSASAQPATSLNSGSSRWKWTPSQKRLHSS